MSTPMQAKLAAVSFCYFVYDVVFMTLLGIIDRATVMHHGIVIGGYYAMLVSGRSGGEIIAMLFATEISNPFMHGRTILRLNGLRHTKLYESLEYAYLGLYAYGRLYLGTIITVDTVLASSPAVVKLCAIGLMLQSYYYIMHICGLLRTRYKEFKERESKGVQLEWFNTTPSIGNLDYAKRSTKMKIF